jgi:hypothetical protein
MIVKTLGTEAIAKLIVYLADLLAKKTDNTVDDKVVKQIEKIIEIHVKR